jgi:hypothetical protein
MKGGGWISVETSLSLSLACMVNEEEGGDGRYKKRG